MEINLFHFKLGPNGEIIPTGPVDDGTEAYKHDFAQSTFASIPSRLPDTDLARHTHAGFAFFQPAGVAYGYHIGLPYWALAALAALLPLKWLQTRRPRRSRAPSLVPA